MIRRSMLDRAFPWVPKAVAALGRFDRPGHFPWHEFPAQLVPSTAAEHVTFGHWCQRPICRQNGGTIHGEFFRLGPPDLPGKPQIRLFLIAQCKRCHTVHWQLADHPA